MPTSAIIRFIRSLRFGDPAYRTPLKGTYQWRNMFLATPGERCGGVQGTSAQVKTSYVWSSTPLFSGVVVVTKRPRQFPRPVFVLPQIYETPFTCSIDGLGFRVQKPVHAHFDGSITLHVVNL